LDFNLEQATFSAPERLVAGLVAMDGAVNNKAATTAKSTILNSMEEWQMLKPVDSKGRMLLIIKDFGRI